MIYLVYKNTHKGRHYLIDIEYDGVTYAYYRHLAWQFRSLEEAKSAARTYRCEVEIIEGERKSDQVMGYVRGEK